MKTWLGLAVIAVVMAAAIGWIVLADDGVAVTTECGQNVVQTDDQTWMPTVDLTESEPLSGTFRISGETAVLTTADGTTIDYVYAPFIFFCF